MYIRECPNCHKEIKYTRLINFNNANKLNRLCQSCTVRKYSKSYLTKEKCRELALLCTSRKEFRKKYPGAYNNCQKNKWMDDFCFHMKKTGNYYKRSIYVYEFSDMSVYIGLTYNLDERTKNHLKDKKSGVYNHIKICKNYNIKQISDYIDKELASKLEDETINRYKKDGWTILNKQKGGNLGGTIVKWSKGECLKVGMKCKTRKEFIVKFPGAYVSSVKNGWINEIYSNFINIVKSKNYWTKEKCQQEALKYELKSEFRKLSISAYNISIRNKWIDEICHHMKTNKIQKGYWTKEKCKEISLNYKSITKFRIENGGAYKACSKNNWLDEIKMDLLSRKYS